MRRKNTAKNPVPRHVVEDVLASLRSYGGIRFAARVINYSPTHVSRILRGIIPVTESVAGIYGWKRKDVWTKE